MAKTETIFTVIVLGVISSIIASLVWEKYQQDKSTTALTTGDKHSDYWNFIGANPYTQGYEGSYTTPLPQGAIS